MMFLHCGWPRTGTSSLQAALFEQRERLAAAGIVYPTQWLHAAGPAHHGLYDMLGARRESAAAFDELEAFLGAHADRDVLLSAEGLTNWLRAADRREALLALLAAAQGVMPVRCVWTLRSIDQALGSLNALGLAAGVSLPPSGQCISDWDDPRNPFEVSGVESLFEGMRIVEEAVAGEVAYVKYSQAGDHNEELLRAFGLPASVRASVGRALERGPRRNVGLGRFEGDRAYGAMDDERRKAVNEQALAAASSQGITAYAEFFGAGAC